MKHLSEEMFRLLNGYASAHFHSRGDKQMDEASEVLKKKDGRREFQSRRDRIESIKQHGTQPERDLLDVTFMISQRTLTLIEKVKKGDWEHAGYADQQVLFGLRQAVIDLSKMLTDYAG